MPDSEGQPPLYLAIFAIAMLALLLQKTIRPVVDATFPLDRAAEAHEYLEGRHAFGKVVLEI